MRYLKLATLLLVLLSGSFLFAQTNEQKALEKKRAQLQSDIRAINRLLFAETKEKGTVLDQMESLEQKINAQQQLIRITNQQSNLLNRQINANVRNIGTLKKDLLALKDDYAQMIQKSYQNKSQQSRLMFLLSSENFLQAYKRLQYIKQYTQYRQEQGLSIVAKTDTLKLKNQALIDQRKLKEQLLKENVVTRKELEKEKNAKDALLSTIKKNESKYTATINKKKSEARRIDQQIEKLIRSAIVATNKKTTGKTASNTSSTKFVLTPEAKVVANNFTANKGKLIWPVAKGFKSKGFGVYKDAVYPGIKHQNNGVIIAADKGTKARSIFEGEVIAVLAVPGGNKGVQIKHGNYITTYYNLSSTYVEKGDKVTAKQEIGEIATNKFNGQTLLKFYLYKDVSKLNPEEWIYQL
ncbi:murein hydrolase activator EnvC family protein [Cellulophaga fucicola]|uniref:Septal ring factor EnvC, activator of murein hydrolases AmiA and AmiB n=1 Tax=Cellulophaga fucicola TaxID=76595 RepID=A0A1K1PS15_9FLAO|nr:peptidoglycan DD-metalloendopeptidase family protein [Cellulophaga fucicola]SFW50253.1 Septal ring factor EnvC, activator of murein hydrolases AmiA and AmiB [Cellulophaga fucicola]